MTDPLFTVLVPHGQKGGIGNVLIQSLLGSKSLNPKLLGYMIAWIWAFWPGSQAEQLILVQQSKLSWCPTELCCLALMPDFLNHVMPAIWMWLAFLLAWPSFSSTSRLLSFQFNSTVFLKKYDTWNNIREVWSRGWAVALPEEAKRSKFSCVFGRLENLKPLVSHYNPHGEPCEKMKLLTSCRWKNGEV